MHLRQVRLLGEISLVRVLPGCRLMASTLAACKQDSCWVCYVLLFTRSKSDGVRPCTFGSLELRAAARSA